MLKKNGLYSYLVIKYGLQALSLCLMASLFSCASSFYQPRPYLDDEVAAFEGLPGAATLTYQTSQGEQAAFYLPNQSNSGKMPDRIWMIYSGIGSLALDWMPWLSDLPDDNIAFFLLDYPGYGKCNGTANASRILESSNAALDALAEYLRVDRSLLEVRMGFLGHSLGTGTALQFAVQVDTSPIILISPFTDLRDLIRYRYGWLIGGLFNLLNSEYYPNQDLIDELALWPRRPKIIIFHGDKDQVIPVSMGRALAQRHPAITTYHELKGAGHKNFLSHYMDRIFKAIKFSEKWMREELNIVGLHGVEVPKD